jgi:outer membrane protein assembly factor BamA
MPEGRSISWLAQLGHRHLHDHLFSKSGFDYGYNFASSIPAWSTSDHTMTHVFYYRHYLRNLTGPEHENLNFQAELGLSHGMPVNGEAPFRIGGSTSIRGYELNSIEGNAYVQFNMEYLRPVGEHRDWRWLMFVDAGNAFPSGNDITLNGLYWSTGVGMRWRLKRFVKINLRLDYAYAFDTGERKIYAGTHETF